MHLCDGAAHSMVHRNIFVRSEEIFDGVVGISMRGDEINGHMIGRGVFQEIRHPRSGGSGGTAYTQTRVYSLQSTRSVSVEVEVGLLAGNATPEIDVRLVPDFEVPLRDFINAISVDEMLREMSHQRVPPLHTFGWRHILLVPEGVQRIGIKCQFLWHEADFDERTDAVFE